MRNDDCWELFWRNPQLPTESSPAPTLSFRVVVVSVTKFCWHTIVDMVLILQREKKELEVWGVVFLKFYLYRSWVERICKYGWLFIVSKNLWVCCVGALLFAHLELLNCGVLLLIFCHSINIYTMTLLYNWFIFHILF